MADKEHAALSNQLEIGRNLREQIQHLGISTWRLQDVVFQNGKNPGFVA